MMRVIVADDEPVARRGLIDLLKEEGEVEVVGEAGDGASALELIRQQRPDVAFLDIRMTGLDGVAVADALQELESAPLIVFVTAYDQHTLRAFDLDAADYLLKPLEPERLRRTLGRLEERLRRAALDEVHQGLRTLRRLARAGGVGGVEDRLVVEHRGRTHLISPREVSCVEADGNYVKVRTDDQEHLMRGTVTEMEQRLTPHGFVRISRSALVNLARVRRVEPGTSGTFVVALESGRRLPVSRRSVSTLRRAMERLK